MKTTYNGVAVPTEGAAIGYANGVLQVPENPIIPFIEGDGTGRDIWKASRRVFGAAVQGFDKVIQYLADHGAKLDVKDKRGKTPLDAAMGLAGGFGFDGSAGEVHETTAVLIRKLLAGSEASNRTPAQ